MESAGYSRPEAWWICRLPSRQMLGGSYLWPAAKATTRMGAGQSQTGATNQPGRFIRVLLDHGVAGDRPHPDSRVVGLHSFKLCTVPQAGRGPWFGVARPLPLCDQ